MIPLLLLVSAVVASGASTSAPDSSPRDQWLRAMSKFESYAHPLKPQFVQHLNVITEDGEISMSTECRHGLRNFSSGLSRGHVHETTMFDAFSKVLPGMFSFQGYFLGSYEQCLDHGRYVYLGIEFPVPKDTKVRKFKQEDGQDDWMVDYSHSIGVRRSNGFHFGICVPDQCRDADVKAVFDSKYVKQLITPLSVRIHTTDSKTDVVTKSWRQVISTSILLLIFGTGVVAAIANKLAPGSLVAHRLRHFDALSNAEHLVSPPKQVSMFTTVNYFRLLYIVGSIFAHTPVGTSMGVQLVRIELMMGLGHLWHALPTKLIRMALSIAPPFLTFNMLISSCFTTMKYLFLMRSRKVNFAMYLTERMLRILPVLGTVILFTQMLPIVNLGGPSMKHMQTEYADLCYRNGWKVMLFISNFDVSKDMCLPVAWFTSADFQIYFFTFPVLLLAARYPQHAVKFFSGVIGVGILASGAYFMHDGTPPILSIDVENAYDLITDQMASLYQTIYFIPVYGVGMILGYVLLQQNGIQKPVSLVKIWASSNVLGSIFVVIACAYWTGEFVAGPTVEIFYVAVIRTIFAAMFAWAFYELFNCPFRIVQSVASSRLMCTTSRVSMAWFFTHPIHIMFMTAAQDTIQLSVSILVMHYLFILVTSFCTACLLHVFVEIPVSRFISASMKGNPREPVVVKKQE